MKEEHSISAIFVITAKEQLDSLINRFESRSISSIKTDLQNISGYMEQILDLKDRAARFGGRSIANMYSNGGSR